MFNVANIVLVSALYPCYVTILYIAIWLGFRPITGLEDASFE